MTILSIDQRIGLLRADADKSLTLVLWVLLLVCLAMASWHGTWMEALLVGLPAALVPHMLRSMAQPGALHTRLSVAVSLMVFSALMIHQARGMLEFHFAIFCFLAFLLYYRDWKPIVLAAAVIAAHHISFYFMQLNQVPVFAYPTTGSFWIVLLHAVFVVAETAVLVLFARRMRREALEAASVAMLAETIGRGDLASRIDPAEGERTPLFESVVAMQSSLADLIGSVAQETHSIKGVCSELASLSQSARQQSARQNQASKQMASQTRQLAESVGSSNASAQRANEITVTTERVASEGGRVIASTIEEMDAMSGTIRDTADRIRQLGAATDEVSGIVSVIQSIAAQTNLLALNAAIEAARAGEQGRGFAVVADEVRKLAERTGLATTEIQRVIQGIRDSKEVAVSSMESMVESVGRGVSLTGEVQQSIAAISSSAQEAVAVVATIADRLNAQALVASEIGQQVNEVAVTADQNDVLVARVAELALDIESTIEHIQAGVGKLRLG